ncbi:MAG: alpha/beta fold hydrolase [Acidobacteriaceae bacterium]|nr:alpha/beta fold hydrolase [Acidobacteriaceae bacterium]
MRKVCGVVVVLVLALRWTSAQSLPAAIFTDPPADAAHPAGTVVLHIPSHGVSINGLLYTPTGAGPHPTLVLCHGLPGNEKNLDLAQAVRRAGWNAVTFNYRGSWGSPGSFRFTQNPEDAASVLAYLRDPANAARLGVDPGRIVLAGHSMGGWVTALTASRDSKLLGAILISAADFGAIAHAPRETIVALMADNRETLADVTPQSMADEVIAHAGEFSFSNATEGLSHLPLLVLSADDDLAPQTDALVRSIQARGGKRVTAIHAATDHAWSDRRIYLQATILNWLATLK